MLVAGVATKPIMQFLGNVFHSDVRHETNDSTPAACWQYPMCYGCFTGPRATTGGSSNSVEDRVGDGSHRRDAGDLADAFGAVRALLKRGY